MINIDKRRARNMRYYYNHQEELTAKRNAKYRKTQDARLGALITDYAEGMTIKELCDKYKGNERK